MSRSVALATRMVGLAGATWGTVLLVRGPAVWSAVVGSPPSEMQRRVVQILAVRHLGQGLVQTVAPRHLQRLWVFVDLAHAASMVGLAVATPAERRPAAVTGGIAVASAIVTGLLTKARDRRR